MTAPIVVSDVDGTLTAAETWRGILQWIRSHHPSPAARRFVVVRLPMVVLAKVGLYANESFRARWLHDMATLLRGVSADGLATMGEWVVDRHLWPARRQIALVLFADAVRDARTSDPETAVILATGAYQQVGDAFARRVGADGALGTPLELRDGVATGRLAAPMQSGEQKAAALLTRAAGGELLAAFGDTASDIPLLSLASRAVAVAPDRVLRRVAVARGWEIVEAP